jgi:8-oxo-dGTP pyrophosphatase MutT (NUDIX family)
MSTDEAAVREDFSAGGVVVDGERMVAIVPVKRAADGSRVLGLPKGHLDGDETAEEAAAREVSEEAGVTGRLLSELGEVEYHHYDRSGRRVHKVVRFFLFEYEAGDIADHDHEIEWAEWITLEDATRRLTYEGEREMVRRALSMRTADR